MEYKRLFDASNHHRENGEKKYHPNALKDVKRKLSFVNKKISDLQRQRRHAYKNSAKVKRLVHNQVNQIVKCLRARERSLLTDVDEIYISQDANITDELSCLQSVHGRCQALFYHMDDIRGNIDVLAKIYSIFSEVNFAEKPEIKPLEFISDFEAVKSTASSFGCLDGDFVKKDKIILIDEKEDNDIFNICKEFHDKEEWLEKTVLTNIETEASKICSVVQPCKQTESEDSFEIVDLLENMRCEDFDKNSILVEEENYVNCFYQSEEKGYTVSYSSENDSNSMKVDSSLENSCETLKKEDFDPEEEWKQIFEMKKKIKNLCKIPSKLSYDNKSQSEIQKSTSNHSNADKSYDKSCKKESVFRKDIYNWFHDRNPRKHELCDKNIKQNKFVFIKEADNWLHERNLEKGTPEKERNFESTGINFVSPAEIIRQSCSRYLIQGCTENWLLSYE